MVLVCGGVTTLRMKIFVHLRRIIVMTYSSCKHVFQCLYLRLNDSRIRELTLARLALDLNLITISCYGYLYIYLISGNHEPKNVHADNPWFPDKQFYSKVNDLAILSTHLCSRMTSSDLTLCWAQRRSLQMNLVKWS